MLRPGSKVLGFLFMQAVLLPNSRQDLVGLSPGLACPAEPQSSCNIDYLGKTE